MHSEPSLGIPTTRFVESVREALGRADEPPTTPYRHLTEDTSALELQVADIRRRIESELPELMEQFATTAGLRGWNVCRATDGESALDYVVSLGHRLGVASAARSEQSVFETVPVDAALAGSGIICWPAIYADDGERPAVRRRLSETGMGITGADYAVSETGSVIVLPRRGLSRLVSVVPPVHIAIVRPQDVIGTLDDLFTVRRLEYHRNGGEMGSYLNFITGPSRTADIEQTIVEGVHGPREVHLVLLEKE